MVPHGEQIGLGGTEGDNNNPRRHREGQEQKESVLESFSWPRPHREAPTFSVVHKGKELQAAKSPGLGLGSQQRLWGVCYLN